MEGEDTMERDEAIIDLTRAVFKTSKPLIIKDSIVADTETSRQFSVNIEIREIVSMSAGLTGKGKLN